MAYDAHAVGCGEKAGLSSGPIRGLSSWWL